MRHVAAAFIARTILTAEHQQAHAAAQIAYEERDREKDPPAFIRCRDTREALLAFR